MSVVRPARSALSKCVAPASTASIAVTPCRHFHSSVARAKRQPRFQNIKAEELGLTKKPATMAQYTKRLLPEYTEEELAQLRARYTPEQVEAIQAGQKAVDAEDMLIQGRIRDDPYRPTYVEDYTKLDPRYDLMPQAEGTPREHKWLNEQDWVDKFSAQFSEMVDRKTDSQLTRAMVRALRRVKEAQGAEMIDLTEEELAELEQNPEMLQKYIVEDGAEKTSDAAAAAADPSTLLTEAQVQKLDEAIQAEWKAELEKLADEDNVMADVTPSSIEMIELGPAGAQRAESAEAPALGKIPGVEGRYKRPDDAEDLGQDELGEYQEIKRVTGLRLADIKSLYCKILVTRNVSNQTRMGKIRSASIVAIAGNGNGRLGIGMAKSTDSSTAVVTAQMLAIRNMKAIRRYENRTVYGNSTGKVGATVVELYNRPPGMFFSFPPPIQVMKTPY